MPCWLPGKKCTLNRCKPSVLLALRKAGSHVSVIIKCKTYIPQTYSSFLFPPWHKPGPANARGEQEKPPLSPGGSGCSINSSLAEVLQESQSLPMNDSSPRLTREVSLGDDKSLLRLMTLRISWEGDNIPAQIPQPCAVQHLPDAGNCKCAMCSHRRCVTPYFGCICFAQRFCLYL